MLRVIIDTNVFISYLLTKSTTINRIYDYWIQNKFDCYYCSEMYEELKKSLQYERISEIVDYNQKSALLIKYKLTSLKININKVSLPKACRDRDDELILKAAVKVKADLIVTGDKDLLVLKNIGSTKIIRPKDFLSLLNS